MDERPTTSPPAPSSDLRSLIGVPWTRPQRGVLFGFVLILSCALFVRLCHNRQYVSDPQPAKPTRFDELADRLDPNVATWQELAVLPQLGEKRAREIVETRQRWRIVYPARPPFQRAEDLYLVKGIGPAMIETIRPYLTFPATQPATQPIR
jgi:competence protein ComEA